MPMRTKYEFPTWMAVEAPDHRAPVIVKAGVLGHWTFPAAIKTLDQAEAFLQCRYGAATRPLLTAERDAAWCGSMFGWYAESACPLYWELRNAVNGQRQRGELP